ncbi:hypothetical protein HYU11_04625 [Candidatus Woesearchaeota archaeon]|nr:hypothetical protein [Candidatus Woesearchaeota archaeon]
MRWILFVLAVLASLALAFFIFSSRGGLKEIEIVDNCGSALGRQIHTIADSDECSGRCGSACVASDLMMQSFEFNMSDVGCNTCRCMCR